MLTLVFDMGNVLLEYAPARFVAKFVSDPADQKLIRQELFGCPEWLGTDMGLWDFDTVAEAARRSLPERLHPLVDTILADYASEMTALPGVGPMLDTLLTEGHDVYLLSNVGSKYDIMRKNIPHIDRFKGEFLSYQAHLLKPDVAIFQKFCQQYSLDPENCFFVDDSPANIFAARLAGMQGMVFRGDPAAVTETVHRLEQNP